MTANSTARLGLMSPVDSDLFEASDFATTFGILDAVPGVTIVNNYSALTALGWGTAQTGSLAVSKDNRSLWIWTGTIFQRANSVGLLNYTTQAAPVSTTVTTAGGGPTFISSGNFSCPGGRYLICHLNLQVDNSAGTNSIAIVTVYDNGSQVDEFNYRVGTAINANGTNHHVWSLILPAAASTHNLSYKIRSAIPATSGGGGTTVARGSRLSIVEV